MLHVSPLWWGTGSAAELASLFSLAKVKVPSCDNGQWLHFAQLTNIFQMPGTRFDYPAIPEKIPTSISISIPCRSKVNEFPPLSVLFFAMRWCLFNCSLKKVLLDFVFIPATRDAISRVPAPRKSHEYMSQFGWGSLYITETRRPKNAQAKS